MDVATNELQVQADRILASGMLGRGGLQTRLFNFLLAATLAGKSPKEIEIAVEVFGRRPDFDGAQDAAVRVYVHKLRRRLDEYYRGDAATLDGARLTIPRGEYRLVLAEGASTDLPGEAEPSLAEPPGPAPRRARWLALVLGLSVLANLAIVFALQRGSLQVASRELQLVRESALWRPILQDHRPIFVVVGDYYIFGEADAQGRVARMVRDFDINSAVDLALAVEAKPALASRYVDLDMQYLPVSTAFALNDLLRVLPGDGRVSIVQSSTLEPGMLKSGHVIYVGLLGALGELGMLRDPAFAGSRLAAGESFDELIDKKTGRRYTSEAGEAAGTGDGYRDYGYFSSFAGPNGNRIVIIAGTRDAGLMQTADFVIRRSNLTVVEGAAAGASGYETLLEVSGVRNTSIDAHPVFTQAMRTTLGWDAK
jgi:hypothetical protein